jgi:hypothetical protein
MITKKITFSAFSITICGFEPKVSRSIYIPIYRSTKKEKSTHKTAPNTLQHCYDAGVFHHKNVQHSVSGRTRQKKSHLWQIDIVSYDKLQNCTKIEIIKRANIIFFTMARENWISIKWQKERRQIYDPKPHRGYFILQHAAQMAILWGGQFAVGPKM